MSDIVPSDGRRLSVVAIIVTYRPAPSRLGELLDAIARQVGHVVVVDNGSGEQVRDWLRGRSSPGVTPVLLDDNMGIAAAQNRGVGIAREHGAEAVVFLDQDSSPPSGMVARLLADWAELAGAGIRVAAVGPLARDTRLGGAAAAPGGLVWVDHLISSGSLIPVGAFDAVGPLREELFVDYVDTEWCLRAARSGLACYCDRSLIMRHEFGTPLRVLGWTISGRTPMRQYYLVRNSIWLWRQGWIPFRWKVSKGLRLGVRLLAAAVFARPRNAQWAMTWRGVRHGISGRMGRGHD